MKLLFLLATLVNIAALIGFIWLVSLAFRRHLGWGVAVLLLSPIAAIVFAVKHWQDSRKPFLIYAGSGVAAMALVVAMFVQMGGVAAMTLAQEMERGNADGDDVLQFADQQLDRMEDSGMLDAQGQAELAEMRRHVRGMRNDTADNTVATPATADRMPASVALPPTALPDPAPKVVEIAPSIVAEDTLPMLDLDAVPLRQAHRVVGKRVRALGRDGKTYEGRLSSADSTTLVLEVAFSAGTFSYELYAGEIDSLAVIGH